MNYRDFDLVNHEQNIAHKIRVWDNGVYACTCKHYEIIGQCAHGDYVLSNLPPYDPSHTLHSP